MYLETKDLRAKLLGKEHASYAVILNNLANLYSDMGLYESAVLLYLEARSIRFKQKESKPLPYASTINNLATCYQKQKKYHSGRRKGR